MQTKQYEATQRMRRTGFKYTGKVKVIGQRVTRHRWTQSVRLHDGIIRILL